MTKGTVTPGQGKFEAHKASIAKLLAQLGLLEDRSGLRAYPSDLPSRARRMGYVDMWKYCLDEKLYDFRLIDHSLIQLSINPPSFSFLEAPYSVMTFEEFAVSIVGGDWEIVEEELREEYEFYLSSSVDIKPTTPVRYDYSEDAYREGVHPAAHLHFGIENQVRVCTRRQMSCVSFVLFIVRQFYPRQWEALLVSDAWKDIFREVREHAIPVADKYFTGNDLSELHLF